MARPPILGWALRLGVVSALVAAGCSQPAAPRAPVAQAIATAGDLRRQSDADVETKLTQASRDGGVDCVAWDMRPVVGGKVIVQAKRYKHTVGVSAVRDLYGTVMNEGAAKGILVTTSGYGKSAGASRLFAVTT